MLAPDTTGTGATFIGGAGTNPGVPGVLSVTPAAPYSTGTLTVGATPGSVGAVYNAGAVNDDAVIGDQGTGYFNNTGGTHTVNGNLILGNQSGGNGTYTITGDSAQTTVSFAPGGNPAGSGNPNGALIVGNGGTGTFTQGAPGQSDPGNQVNVAGDMVLGQQVGSVGTYTLNTGTLTVGGQLAVGGQSTGANTFTQNGGTVILTGSAPPNPDYVPVGSASFAPWGAVLAIGGGVGNGDGSNSGGTGTYNLNNGSISTTNVQVGATGTGTMNQSGGEVHTDFLTEGFSGTGTYNLSGNGAIYAYSEGVGYAGTGIFNQSGGTNTIATTLEVGLQYATNTPATGTYNLTGGTLSTGNTVVGDGEQGDFLNNNATHNVAGILTVGEQNINGVGTYTITGNTALTNIGFASGGNGAGNPNGALIVGNYGIGSVTQGLGNQTDAPTVAVAGDVVLGAQGLANGAPTDSSGTYTLNSGSLSVGGKMVVGGGSTGTTGPGNVFTQNGGTVTVSDSLPGSVDYTGVGNSDHSGLLIGGGGSANLDGGTGIYQMNGGTLNASLMEVGHSGVGTFNQTDGIVNNGYALWVGNAGGSTGFYNLSGGALNSGSAQIGSFGTGTFTHTGGSNQITNDLQVGAGSGAVGTYSLSDSGQLTVGGNTTIGDAGNGKYTQSGGSAQLTGNMTLGNRFGSIGSAEVSGGTLSVGGIITVAELGQGTFTQTGGIVSASGLTIADSGTDPNPHGIYNLNGSGQLTINGTEIVGELGNGTFNQGADGFGTTTHSVTGTLIVGDGAIITGDSQLLQRQGTFNLTSGTLSTANTIVGNQGLGFFNQSGGTHGINGTLTLGAQNTPVEPCGGGCATAGGQAQGTYTMTDGSLTANGIGSGTGVVVGDAGIGTFNQIGGSVTSGTPQVNYPIPGDNYLPGNQGDVIIGAQAGSQGTYNLGSTGQPAAPTATVYGGVIIGRDAGSNAGTIPASPGATPANPNLVIQGDGTSLNVYANGGTGNSNPSSSHMLVGLNGNGAVTQSDSSTVYTDGDVSIGVNQGSTGSYSLNATSTPNNNGYNLEVGGNLNIGGAATSANGFVAQTTPSGGTGAFTQTSGDIHVIGNVNLGNNGGTGTYTQSGGTATFFTGTYIGNNGGTGTYNQSGGTVLADGNGLFLGQSNGTGTYNLSDPGATTPTLTITTGRFGYPGSFIVGDSGVGTFNQTGGAVLAGQAAGPGYAGTSNAVFNMTIGNQANIAGPGGTNFASSYNLSSSSQSAPSTLTVNGNLNLGVGVGAAGSLTIGTSGLTTDATSLSVNPDAWNTSLGGNILVGVNGFGQVIQNSGAVLATGGVALGINGGSSGTYAIFGGKLDTPLLEIGGSTSFTGLAGGGTGQFTQNGGTVTAGVVGIGQYGGIGNYDLNDGTLNADVAYVSGNSVGTFNQYGGTFSAAFLDIGILSGGNGTYTTTAGNLNTDYLNVGGNQAQGSFTQSGMAAVTVGHDLYVNNDGSPTPTGGGTYTVNGGSLDVTGNAYIGNGGSGAGSTGGTFVQNSGAVVVSHDLLIGSLVGDVGSYALNDGKLTAGNMYVGDAGTGTVQQKSGTTKIDGSLTLASQAGSTGTYTLAGGSVTAGQSIIVGGGGTGTLTVSNGASGSNGGLLRIGLQAGSNGTMTVTDAGTTWSSGQQVQVGEYGNGTLNVLKGGILNSSTGLVSPTGTAGTLGGYVGSVGTATVDGAGSQWNMTDGALRVGVYSAGNNLLTISNGGTVTDTAGFDGAAASVGWYAGSNGSVVLNNGATWTNTGDLVVGDAGTGSVTKDSTSTINITGQLDLGKQASGIGTFNLNGGTLLDSAVVGDAGTGTFNNTGGTHTVVGDLTLGNQSTGNGTYNLTDSGTTTVSGATTVGAAGTGIFANAGSTHTTANLVLGNVAGGNGTYNLTDSGTTTVSAFTVVGAGGTGTFLNDGSTHNTYALVIGAQGTSTGNLYTLKNGGMLNVGSAGSPGFLDVAEHGSGTFTQTGGTTTVIGALDVGRCGGIHCNGSGDSATGLGNGTVNLSGGSMSVVYDAASSYGGFAVVGDAGNGTFHQSNGASLTADTLTLGRAGGTGTFTLDGAGSTVTVKGLQVGVLSDGGTSTFTQNNGTVQISTWGLDIGVQAAGNDLAGNFHAAGKGAYVLNGGTLNVAGGEIVGDAGTGGFSQSGGVQTLSGNLTVGNQSGGTGTYALGGTGKLNLSDAGAQIVVGSAAGSHGTFNFNTVAGDNGTIGFNANTGQQIIVGNSGTGTFNQGGGDLNLSGQGVGLQIGVNAGSNGTYNLTGGTLEDALIVGDAGTGTFNNTGGTHTVSGNLTLGNQATGAGTYTLGGTGKLNLSDAGAQVIVGSAAGSHGTFNFNTTAGDSGTIGFNANTGQQIIVGNNGNGIFNQGNGDLNLGGNGVTLDIAANAGSHGTYNLSGGTLETSGLTVGDAGIGSFSNTGGAHTVSGSLTVANQAGSAGTYAISGAGTLAVAGDGTKIVLGNAANTTGTLNINTTTGGVTLANANQQLIVGNAGTGLVNQSSGDVSLSGAGSSVVVGAQNASYGQYNLFGGALEAQGLTVGDRGFGQFYNTGGAVTIGSSTIAGNLVVSNQAGSGGSVLLVGGAGSSLTVWGNATIGANAYGNFNETHGATVDVKGSMSIVNGGVGIEGGTLKVGDGGAGNQLLIGSNGSMQIEDNGTVGATATVDGKIVNNGLLNIGNNLLAPGEGPSLTATNGFQNNGSFNFEARSTLNADVTNGNGGNTSAYFSAQNGAGADVTLNGNVDNFAQVNVSSLGNTSSTLTQNGNFTNEAGGLLRVIGSNVTINGTGTALNNAGTVSISQDVNGPSAPISTVAITGDVNNAVSGNISITDSKVTVTGNVTNAGQITAQRDPGKVNVASNVTVNGTLTNQTNAAITVSNSAITVTGATTNNGTVTVSNSTATWKGTFTNNGAYISDPSNNYFSDLKVGPTGYLQGASGDLFDLTGNLTTTSTQNTLWSTGASMLEFSGLDGTAHILDVTGVDKGQTASGFLNNFAWGTLKIDAGNTLTLEGAGKALYVGVLDGLSISGSLITNLTGNGLDIYYDPTLQGNAYLRGEIFAFGDGSFLTPWDVTPLPPTETPEPGSLLLLGSGLAGLAFLRRRAAGLKSHATAR